MAVQRRPDLYSAFISTALIASFAEGQRVAYRFLLAEAERRRARKALAELTSLGGPPHAGAGGAAKWKRCARWLGEFAVWHSSEKLNRVGWMPSSIEYSWPDWHRSRWRSATSPASLHRQWNGCCSRTQRTFPSGKEKERFHKLLVTTVLPAIDS